eukprot:3330660-Alexandrium_andersonii.AAC.1
MRGAPRLADAHLANSEPSDPLPAPQSVTRAPSSNGGASSALLPGTSYDTLASLAIWRSTRSRPTRQRGQQLSARLHGAARHDEQPRLRLAPMVAAVPAQHLDRGRR